MHSIASATECQQILDTKPLVMLEFSAEWCGPCKAAKPIVEKLASQFPDVFMADIDVDAAQDVAAAYKVTALPSFIFFHNRVEVERVRGADISKITAALRALAARTPSFGKGHRVGSHQPKGASASASQPPPTAAEVRAARTRALEKSHARSAVAVKKPATSPVWQLGGLSIGSGLEMVRSFFSYVVLYVLTLFAFDARAKALSLRRERD